MAECIRRCVAETILGDRRPRAFFCCRQLAKSRIVRGIRLYNALLWPVRYKLTESCFPGYGVWVTLDFDSKYKLLWSETRAHGVPIHEEKKRSKQESA